MARLRYRRYRRYRRYPRRLRRRGYRRSRVINRTSRSRVKLNFTAEQYLNLTWKANDSLSPQIYLSPFYQNIAPNPAPNFAINFFPCSIVGHHPYRTFARCYEQVRCCSFKAFLTVTTPVGASQSFNDVTMYSMIERQFSLYDMEHNLFDWNSIGWSSSAKRVTFLNNTINKVGRACYASDLQERTDFVDATPMDRSTEITPGYPDGTQQPNQFINSLQCQCDEQSNVCYPKFCPIICFQGNTADVRNQDRPFKVMVRIACCFEFRGPRFGNSTNATIGAKVADPVVPSVDGEPSSKRSKLDSEVTKLDEDDDMDICLPADERKDSPAAKVLRDEDDDGDDEYKDYDVQTWMPQSLQHLGKDTVHQAGKRLFTRFADRNKDGKIDASELARVLSPLTKLPRPVLNYFVGKAIKASDQAEKDAPMRDTCHPYDEATEKAMDDAFGAVAAADASAKNVNSGGTQDQK